MLQRFNISLHMTGIGYDVHRFAENRPLVLGGVTIPHSHGLDGPFRCGRALPRHRRCRVRRDGPAGHRPLFPARRSGLQGHLFAARSWKNAANSPRRPGLTIINVDSTLIAEAPKVLPHREAMRINIGAALGIPPRAGRHQGHHQRNHGLHRPQRRHRRHGRRPGGGPRRSIPF